MDIWSTNEEGFGDTERLLSESPDSINQTEVSNSHTTTNQQPTIQLYKRRWYILMLFSFSTFTQGGVWNTWSPIARSAERVYGWDDGMLSLLSNWGPIAYLVATPLAIWIMDVKGMRWATIALNAVVFMGTGLRCIPASTATATWLINAGHFFNGLGGPVAMVGAPALSAIWFPANQRITATAIGAAFNGFGVAVSFIIGPLLVPERSLQMLQTTIANITSHRPDYISYSVDDVYNSSVIASTKADIMKLMYIEFGLSAALLLLVVVYFPNKPPTPPSVSATVERTDYVAGIRTIIRLPMFWVLVMVYSLPEGVYAAWGSVLEVNLKAKGISQDLAGWLGFYCSLAGNAGGLLVGKFADVFKRRIKLYLIVFFIGTMGVFFVFTIAYDGYIRLSTELLYSTNIITGSFLSAMVPLFYELACEMTYPVSEGTANGVMTLVNNIFGLVFLFMLMIPNIGTSWMNWCLLGCVAVCPPALLLLQERYTRLDIDIAHAPSGTSQDAIAQI